VTRDLETDYALGSNKYPETPAEVWQVLMVYAEQQIDHEKLKKHQSAETDEGVGKVLFVIKNQDDQEYGPMFQMWREGAQG
jgi:hypothetical protein